jgi:hypothetical protein
MPLAPIEWRPAHHREAVGMEARCLQRQVIAIAFPRGRHDHDPRHTCGIHFLQEIVFREWLWPMW